MRRVILSAAFAISTLTACIYLQQSAHAECEKGWECSEAIGAPPPPPHRPTDAEFHAARHADALRKCDAMPTTVGVLLCRMYADE